MAKERNSPVSQEPDIFDEIDGVISQHLVRRLSIGHWDKSNINEQPRLYHTNHKLAVAGDLTGYMAIYAGDFRNTWVAWQEDGKGEDEAVIVSRRKRR